MHSPGIFKKVSMRFRSDKNGIVLLITVLILTAILSIGIGVFNMLYGELQITGSVEDSIRAFNASAHGIERTLYRDRMQVPLANGATETITLPSNAGCYTMTTLKVGVATQIRVVGEYPCATGVRRAFRVSY